MSASVLARRVAGGSLPQVTPMRRLAVLLVLTLSLPLTAHADEASRRVKPKEMINLLHMDQLRKQMMDGMMQQVSTMSKQMVGNSITPEDQLEQISSSYAGTLFSWLSSRRDLRLSFAQYQRKICSKCEVSIGCPFDLTARSCFCEESVLSEGPNGPPSQECPTLDS
jgi:hypothetical protein